MPKVSIVMPAYNAEKYIAQAIDSILHQTFTDWELIVVDDGSTDITLEIASTYLSINDKNNRRIRVLSRENYGHQGIVYVLNRGLDLATGQYIARHDADDYSDYRRLQTQVDFLDASRLYGIDVVGSSMLLIDKDGFPFDILKYPQQVTRKDLMEKCCVAHPTVMFRRQVYNTIGGYDTDFDMNCCEDYDYWLRVSEKFKIFNLSRVLYTKRVHDESNIGRAKRETIKAFDDLARVKARIRCLKNS